MEHCVAPRETAYTCQGYSGECYRYTKVEERDCDNPSLVMSLTRANGAALHKPGKKEGDERQWVYNIQMPGREEPELMTEDQIKKVFKQEQVRIALAADKAAKDK